MATYGCVIELGIRKNFTNQIKASFGSSAQSVHSVAKNGMNSLAIGKKKKKNFWKGYLLILLFDCSAVAKV